MEEFKITEKNINPYQKWLTNRITNKEWSINNSSEMDYVNFLLENGGQEGDFEYAIKFLKVFNSNKENLIACLYIKMGDYENAKMIIEKHPEINQEILNYVKLNNLDCLEKLGIKQN